MPEKKSTPTKKKPAAKTAAKKSADKPVRPKKKPSDPTGHYLPSVSNLNVNPGDNTRLIQLNAELFNLPPINRRNYDELAARIQQYFEIYAKYDVKPTVMGLALALSWNRQTLWAVAHDKPVSGRGNLTNLPPECADLLKKTYFFLENLWETYMSTGKMNPVAGIFLGKNHFGYEDRVEHVVSAGSGGDVDVAAIRERYADGGELGAGANDFDPEGGGGNYGDDPAAGNP